MRYEYTYRNTAFELWQVSMYYIYGSMAGMCNVVFTAAAFALGYARWNQSGSLMRFIIVLGCCLFTLIQPLMLYIKAGRQAAGITQDTRIALDDWGVHIRVGEKTSDLPWKAVRKISRKPTMIIIFSDTVHGFVLTNRVLGDEKEAFAGYVISKIKQG